MNNTSDGRAFFLKNRYFVWIFNPADRIIIQGVREKLCFPKSTANQPSPSYRCKRSFKLNSMWMYCRSYWCAIFCTTNNSSPVLPEGLQNFDNSLKKYNISWTPCSEVRNLSSLLTLCRELWHILNVNYI